jgi:hypothetical protein
MHDEATVVSQIAATLLAGSSPGSMNVDPSIQAAVRAAFRIVDVVREQQKQRQPALEPADNSSKAATDDHRFREP